MDWISTSKYNKCEDMVKSINPDIRGLRRQVAAGDKAARLLEYGAVLEMVPRSDRKPQMMHIHPYIHTCIYYILIYILIYIICI